MLGKHARKPSTQCVSLGDPALADCCAHCMTQVLCVRDMLQHCDAVLLLDNDSLFKQAAAKPLKPSPGTAGGGGGGAAACVSMTLSDANKVPAAACFT